MNSRERILKVLNGEIPDRAPWLEIGFSSRIAGEIIRDKFIVQEGYSLLMDPGQYRVDLQRWIRLAKTIGLDAIGCNYWVPGLAGEQGGTRFDDVGLIKSHEDLKRESAKLPDMAHRDYSCGKILVDTCRENGIAAFLLTHFLVEQTVYSFGFARFCYMLHDNRKLVEDLMDFFTEYSAQNIMNLMEIKPDFLLIGDDLAYGQGPFVSPQDFKDLFMPRYRRLAKEITCPWIFHSDGNLMPIIDDLLSLGMNAIHPLEPYGMDIAGMKKRYGDRIVLTGNLDMSTIANGTPEDIDRAVKWLWDNVGKFGGWILSSSNSIDSGANPENVIALGRALRKYGVYEQ